MRNWRKVVKKRGGRREGERRIHKGSKREGEGKRIVGVKEDAE